MTRTHPVSQRIYRSHIRHFRFLNDLWIFTQLVRPQFKARGEELRASKSKAKKRYPVPKRSRVTISRRTDADVGQVFIAQYERGVFETNIISIVSRTEAFVQECLLIAISANPEKLSILDKSGIPLDLFLTHEDRSALLERLVALRCQELMFAKPADYMRKVSEVLSVEIPEDRIEAYIELKATRDVLIHNQGLINRIYLDKAGQSARGGLGEELEIDADYFGEAIMSSKGLSGAIQAATEEKYA